MRTFKMVDGDIHLENGKLSMVEDQEELRQNTENRLAINIKEWFLDIELGLDYSEVRGKRRTDRDIELAMRDCVTQDERIKDIRLISVERNLANRTTEISIAIEEVGGDTQYLKEVIDID